MLTPSPNLATQRPIVAVLVPTHRGIHPLTQKALSAMMAATCGHVVLRVLGAAPVHQVRNNLLAPLYLNKSQFDYVLFCDDDMVPPPDGLNVLLSEHVDIIAAICTNRPPLPKGGALNAGIRLSGQDFQPSVIVPKVQKVDYIGAGFMLLSRKALNVIAEYSIAQTYHTRYMGMTAEFAAEQARLARRRFNETGNAYWFEYLRNPTSGNEYGEDVSFCVKARECGFDIYGDSRIAVGHIGANVIRRHVESAPSEIRSIEDFRYRTTIAHRDDGTYTAVTTVHTPVHTPPQPTT